MSRILVISDNFTGGGLETQLTSQIKHLRNYGFEFYLATSSPKSDLALALFDSCVFDLNFTQDSTPLDLLYIHELLLDYIKKYKIDLIHAHPFYAPLVSLALAENACLPLVATLHGPASLNFFPPGSTPHLLLTRELLPNVNHLFAVSSEVRLLAARDCTNLPTLLPNAVDMPSSSTTLPDNAPWMWAGRIDDEKYGGLEALIRYAASRHQLLSIYGDGPALSQLNLCIDQLGSDSQYVKYCGWTPNISTEMNAHTVIAGMGRVILEGAARNHPCLLVGYDGIKGFVTCANVEDLSFFNFSGRQRGSVEWEALDAQVAEMTSLSGQFQIQDWVCENRNGLKLWDQYLDHIREAQPFRGRIATVLPDIFRYYAASCESFWYSPDIHLLLGEILSRSSTSQQGS